MIETLAMYWGFPFVRYALIVGVMIALCSSLPGVTLVLKRFSFIWDGLSHVAFGAMAAASVLNLGVSSCRVSGHECVSGLGELVRRCVAVCRRERWRVQFVDSGGSSCSDSAGRVFKTFKAVTVCSAGVSVVCAVAGMAVSAVCGTPVGSTVVMADLDLTKFSSMMVYTGLFNVMANPSAYVGKTIKLRGQFDMYHDEETGKDYYGVAVMDAGASCERG
ncbi:MAG: metal ABC transporter permease [Synergistaceae bacterium]|nr:metal ABC transporter permease [Synergistaceae bacterium]